jgi:hypothetical protein
MTISLHPKRGNLGLLPRIAAVLFLAFSPLIVVPANAETNVSVSADFRASLEPHGRWTHHDRWGDVWAPSRVDKDWAPYTRGRWVYTDDWGWYWVSDESEADWGWAAFHYGRWVLDPDYGWIWIPGREWAPAWVTWRRGGHRVGWAPQPPDEIYVEIRDDPHYWMFVEPRNLISDRIWTEAEPGWGHTEFLQDTVIVNRTVIVRERGPIFAVNPGVEPDFIAREVGAPIRTYEVQPRILAGTADIKEAIEVRPGEAPGKHKEKDVVLRETSDVIEPAKSEEPPKALAPDEKGRLGERPPRAAVGIAGAPPSQPTGEEPGKKAVEEAKPERGKAAEEGKPEQPAKKAVEEAKPEPGKAAEEAKPVQPGKKAVEEEAKPKQPGKKAVEEAKPEPGKVGKETKPEQEGKKSMEETKPAPGKKATEEAKPEQPSKRVEEKGKSERLGNKPEAEAPPKSAGKKAAEEGGPDRRRKSGAGEQGKSEPHGKRVEEQGKPEQRGKDAEPPQQE